MASTRNWISELPELFKTDLRTVIISIGFEDGLKYWNRLVLDAPEHVPELLDIDDVQFENEEFFKVLISISIGNSRCDLIDKWSARPHEGWLLALGMRYSPALEPVVNKLLVSNEVTPAAARGLLKHPDLRERISTYLCYEAFAYVSGADLDTINFLDRQFGFKTLGLESGSYVMWSYLTGNNVSPQGFARLVELCVFDLAFKLEDYLPSLTDFIEALGLMWVVDPSSLDPVAVEGGGPIKHVLAHFAMPEGATAAEVREMAAFFHRSGHATFAFKLLEDHGIVDAPFADKTPIEWLVQPYPYREYLEDQPWFAEVTQRLETGTMRECIVIMMRYPRLSRFAYVRALQLVQA